MIDSDFEISVKKFELTVRLVLFHEYHISYVCLSLQQTNSPKCNGKKVCVCKHLNKKVI